jgi:glycosyltransferase involved in cell wall biosynthesis
MRILTCIGDATSIHTHGGLPFHLLEAGRNAGFIDCGWKLAPDKLRIKRALWNLRRLATHGEVGGYQYSPDFIRSLIRQAPGKNLEADEVISIFPLLPMDHAKFASVSLYIDATLKGNFEDYRLGEKLGKSIVSEALDRERSLYRQATRIVCRSKVAAKSVIEDYEVNPENVHFVPGGANIPQNAVTLLPAAKFETMKPLRLGFIGKDWRRKNLPFLLDIADCLHARGLDVEVVAAGFDATFGPKHRLLRSVGFIDKHRDIDRFVAFIRSCHFLCLFSLAEAFGISNREGLRLGVPILARDVGGIRDAVPHDCGHLFQPTASADEVADVVGEYADDFDRYRSLRARVAERSNDFTWDAAVQKMQEIWAGSKAHSYSAVQSAHA